MMSRNGLDELKMEHKDKLISFPKVILDTLHEYKQKTGISASDYIRTSLIKQMILDELIWFKTKYIIQEVDKVTEKEVKTYIDDSDARQVNSFCDGDKCELPLT